MNYRMISGKGTGNPRCPYKHQLDIFMKVEDILSFVDSFTTKAREVPGDADTVEMSVAGEMEVVALVGDPSYYFHMDKEGCGDYLTFTVKKAKALQFLANVLQSAAEDPEDGIIDIGLAGEML